MRGPSGLEDCLFTREKTLKIPDKILQPRLCGRAHLLQEMRYCPVATVLLLLVPAGHRRQKHSLAHSDVCRTTEHRHRGSTGGRSKSGGRTTSCGTFLKLRLKLRRVAGQREQLQRRGDQQERPRRRGNHVRQQQEGNVHGDPVQRLKLLRKLEM